MNAPSLRALLVAAAAALAGCIFETDDRVAGGAEDFPNTVALGAALSDDISSHADWDNFSNIPAALPSFKGVDSLVAEPGPGLEKTGAGALAKAAARPDTTWDLSDTAAGIARRYISYHALTKVRMDTAVVRYDAAFKDSLPGNELVLRAGGKDSTRSGGRVQTYLYVNADSAGPLDSAVLALRTRGLDSRYRSHLLIAVGGPDGDIFTLSDNVPVHYAYARTDAWGPGADTLDAFEISDADGDGRLWAAGDSGLVDFREKRTDPSGRPGVKTLAHKLRAVLFKDENKTYPVSFQETRVDDNGKRVVFSVRGLRADSAFGPGDTVIVSVRTVSAPGQSRFLERNARFVILLSATPKRFEENRLLAFTLETLWRPDAFRKGGLVRTRFRFQPDSPVLSRTLALEGTLEVEVEFADGSTGTLKGRRRADQGFEGELVENLPDGTVRRLELLWNRTGDLVRLLRR